jgi:hypothetical protein
MAGDAAPGTIAEGIRTPIFLCKYDGAETGKFWVDCAIMAWDAPFKI